MDSKSKPEHRNMTMDLDRIAIDVKSITGTMRTGGT
jgi:hypothetical protein